MLNPTDPTRVLFKDARRKLPDGRSKSQMDLYRRKGRLNWMTGERVILESVWTLNGWATTPAAWERFLLALNKGNGRA
jgi:hypothetical protein